MARETHVIRRLALILQLLRDKDEVLTCQQITDELPCIEDTRWGPQAITYGNVYAGLRELHRTGKVMRTKTTSGTYWGAAISTSELAQFEELVAIFRKEPSE